MRDFMKLDEEFIDLTSKNSQYLIRNTAIRKK